MNPIYDSVLSGLLRAGHPDGAWAFVRDAAREYGSVLCDEATAAPFDEFV
jgi:pentatricopeptide repeat protein